MRTDLDHLPSARQRELERVVRILFEEFESARADAVSERRRTGRINKVILYGSYARGSWVEEPHTEKGYRSDFDILVVVDTDELTDMRYWEAAEQRLYVETEVTKALKTPVSLIVHTTQQVNDGLAHGRYFFMDLVRDGIALYQADDVPLLAPRPKTPEQALALASEYFQEWLPSSVDFLDGYRDAIGRGRMRKAAFDLHQAAERLYHCVLLVSTFYTPHVHNIAFLRRRAEQIDGRLTRVWPSSDRRDRARFQKLKDAYVKARYASGYQITEEELRWLGTCVEELGQAVHAVCSDRIASLKALTERSGRSADGT